ncbi:GroES-like protein [Bimuria novae-zelandiae CBS 107.79]|uniref:GroES-like protein n=1 Tax=Bimuria novae-zelandiae CBS 107.79 TaxID=1447943 RepID=A0A6A5UUS3_9PLEO|nr:GroES-like protein [Bimuria novae-zelandiae CBS 107.79]
MATQKAIAVQEVGKPVVAVSNYPIHQPGPKQVQVRVTVAALNPHDQKGRDIGLFTQDCHPVVLGSDVVGVVTVLGEGATRFKVGDRIFGQAALTPDSSSKALQQFAILDEDFASVILEGVSEDDAATIPTNHLAPYIGFFSDEQGLGLPTLGAWLVGLGTIVVVGGKEEELKGFGATHVVDRHGGHDVVLKRIRDIVGDDLVYAFDAANVPAEQYLAINALSNSKLGALARLLSRGPPTDASKTHHTQNRYVLKGVLGFSHLHQDLATPLWKHIAEYLVEGRIKPSEYVVEQGLDTEKVNAVFDCYRDGQPVIHAHFRISEYVRSNLFPGSLVIFRCTAIRL